jgi:hypothetical protein
MHHWPDTRVRTEAGLYHGDLAVPLLAKLGHRSVVDSPVAGQFAPSRAMSRLRLPPTCLVPA